MSLIICHIHSVFVLFVVIACSVTYCNTEDPAQWKKDARRLAKQSQYLQANSLFQKYMNVTRTRDALVHLGINYLQLSQDEAAATQWVQRYANMLDDFTNSKPQWEIVLELSFLCLANVEEAIVDSNGDTKAVSVAEKYLSKLNTILDPDRIDALGELSFDQVEWLVTPLSREKLFIQLNSLFSHLPIPVQQAASTADWTFGSSCTLKYGKLLRRSEWSTLLKQKQYNSPMDVPGSFPCDTMLHHGTNQRLPLLEPGKGVSWLGKWATNPKILNRMKKAFKSGQVVHLSNALHSQVANSVLQELRSLRKSEYGSPKQGRTFGFQFHHHNIFIQEKRMSQKGLEMSSDVLRHVFDAPDVKAIFSWLLDEDLFAPITGGISKYFPGDYSAPHPDIMVQPITEGLGREYALGHPVARRVAFVIHLCDHWTEYYGGDFMWYFPMTRIPCEFNRITLFPIHVNSLHSVNPVHPTLDQEAPNASRFAIHGWLTTYDIDVAQSKQNLYSAKDMFDAVKDMFTPGIKPHDLQ